MAVSGARVSLGWMGLATMLAAGGCAPPMAEDKGLEEDVPLDGKLDSFRSPTDHGSIGFDAPVTAELTTDAGFHAWTFDLTAPASLTLRTGPETVDGRTVDTVMYLYREGERGFGRALTSNDDAGGTLFSAISRQLEAGHYRVLVKGYSQLTRGHFSLTASCEGEGCAPPYVSACLFGDTFYELRMAERPASTFERQLDASAIPELSALQRAQIVLAVQQSAHRDVMTVEEAFDRVDQGQVRQLELFDAPGARSFTAFEYGAGDNSYGAIFAARSETIVASIHDGDLYDCSVGREVCLLGTTYREFRDAPTFTTANMSVLRDASTLSPVRTAQLLRAVQEAYADAADVGAAFESVDGGEVNELIRRDASGRVYIAYEYGAGDNSYGAIFEEDSITPIARINDSDLYGCALLGTP